MMLFWLGILIFSLLSLIALSYGGRDSSEVKDGGVTIDDLTSPELEDMRENNAPQELIEEEIIRLRMQDSLDSYYGSSEYD